jgi:hypothetical protein
VKKLLLATMLVAASGAYANNDKHPVPPGLAKKGASNSSSNSVSNSASNSNARSDARSNSSSVSGARAIAGDASATGGAGGAGGTASSAGGAGGSSTAAGGSGVGTVAVTNSTNNATTNSTHVRPAAYAPSVHPTANCALGASVGIGGALSLGGSHIDENCATIEQAKAIADLGDPYTAQEVLCSLPKVREARLRSGNRCWADKPENQPKVAEPTDPYVRARLGLPTL